MNGEITLALAHHTPKIMNIAHKLNCTDFRLFDQPKSSAYNKNQIYNMGTRKSEKSKEKSSKWMILQRMFNKCMSTSSIDNVAKFFLLKLQTDSPSDQGFDFIVLNTSMVPVPKK